MYVILVDEKRKQEFKYIEIDGCLSARTMLDNIKSQAIESIIGGSGLPGGFGGAGLGGSDLPIGTPDLASPTPQAAAPEAPVQF